jgi:hypothetical protein
MPVAILENPGGVAGVSLISKTVGISALVSGVLTTLYTVPSGKTLTVTQVTIATNTVTGR